MKATAKKAQQQLTDRYDISMLLDPRHVVHVSGAVPAHLQCHTLFQCLNWLSGERRYLVRAEYKGQTRDLEPWILAEGYSAGEKDRRARLAFTSATGADGQVIGTLYIEERAIFDIIAKANGSALCDLCDL